MEELLRTNDAVLITFLEAILKDADIAYHIADQHMSILEGSLGFLPRRILVEATRIEEARSLIIDAGLEIELKR
ncbi:putative signal transducing protein [Flexibacterium corallicola]|uniref:putative signal transducing protein n=1 Tax=Flexibacterium corallicola TaxID=3037259 RepID=UPI00286F879C|nr:DUF2007 domain-containing protein [Pseudovibrio sp. M1P-2-3]